MGKNYNPFAKQEKLTPSSPTLPEVSSYELAIFAAELGAMIPSIDLHGYSRDNALQEIGNFLYKKFPSETEVVKIIHGRGEQKLRSAIHDWLKKHKKDFPYFRDSNNPAEQGGVTYVAVFKN